MNFFEEVMNRLTYEEAMDEAPDASLFITKIDDDKELVGKVNRTKCGYVCSVCGKKILPKIRQVGQELVCELEDGQIRGGLGNKVIKNHVCRDCIEKMIY